MDAVKLSDGTDANIAVTLPPPLPVTGPWHLSVSAGQAVSPQAPVTLWLDRLVSWRELPALRYYAGAATYATDLSVPPEYVSGGGALFLDLGEAFELARVTVNDGDAGTAWARPFRVGVAGRLKPGRNTVEIEVPNILKNHLEKGDACKRPSSLLGPTKLVPVRQATLADSPAPKSTAAPADFRQMDIYRAAKEAVSASPSPVSASAGWRRAMTG